MNHKIRKIVVLGLLAAITATGAVVAQGKDKVVPLGDDGQPNMKMALEHLQKAKDFLGKATQNKGGHRAEAEKLVTKAIEQVQKGIEFEIQHNKPKKK